MLGAILGDIAGSRYEFVNNRVKPSKLWVDKDFFTDDTVLTCATVMALRLGGSESLSKKYVYALKKYVEEFPDKTYGTRFIRWMHSLPEVDEKSFREYVNDYGAQLTNMSLDSFGNGCVMKISPVVYVAKDLETAQKLARQLTRVTHNAKQSYKAVDALVEAMWMALKGKSKDAIKKRMTEFYPDIEKLSYKELNKSYRYSELAEDTMPAAIVCFLESESLDDAIKNAVSIGGDADTLGAVVGALAEAFYKYKSYKEYEDYYSIVEKYLPRDLMRMLDFVDDRVLIKE